MRRERTQRGFTIIEAVVSTAVFAVVVSSSLAVYMATLQLDSKGRAERAVQQNSRFIIDYISKEIRTGRIDYSGTNNATTLSIINQEGDEEVFSWAGCPAGVCAPLLVQKGGVTNLSTSDVIVRNINFILSPSTDPFNLANDVHIQPHVTIIMQLESSDTRVAASSRMDIQTTFTVRDYSPR